MERILHGALQVDHGQDIQRQKSEYVCQVVERRWVRDLQTRVAGAQLCCAYYNIIYNIIAPWTCAPRANIIARKIPGPAAGATTYVEREPAQAENLRQAEEGLDIPLKGLQTALTWAHDFAAKARFRVCFKARSPVWTQKQTDLLLGPDR